MMVLVQVHFLFNDIIVLKKSDLPVHPKNFKDNPDQAAAISANKWIRQLRMKFPKMEIYKVFYNTTDITKLIN
jgi:hypothetical protein